MQPTFITSNIVQTFPLYPTFLTTATTGSTLIKCLNFSNLALLAGDFGGYSIGSGDQTYPATGVYRYTTIQPTSSTAYWIFVCNGCDGSRKLKMLPIMLTSAPTANFKTITIQYWQSASGGGPRVYDALATAGQLTAANISTLYDAASVLNLGLASSLSTGGYGITNIDYIVKNRNIYGNVNFIPGWVPTNLPMGFGYATDATKISFLGFYMSGNSAFSSGFYYSETQGDTYTLLKYISIQFTVLT